MDRPLIDSHVHLFGVDRIDDLNAVREHIGAEAMGIACIYDPVGVNDNPAGFAAKAAYPDRFFVFAGLDHSQHFSGGRLRTSSLAEQVDRLQRIGADGIKLLETKPDRRKAMGIPIDSDYFEGFFARVEETGMPLLWHVADPPEFWDPKLTPRWATSRGWGYDESHVPWETLQRETESVLRRHPRLKVIFAHFLFFSQDLSRAERMFEEFEGVHFDLAPGIELLYNLSKDVERSREFFERYNDRIVFGTDIFGTMSREQAAHRAGLVRRFLETDDEFRVPERADYLLGPPEDGVVRGLALPDDVLAQVYHANFAGMVGTKPRLLDAGLALEECGRIAVEARVSGRDGEAERAAERLSAED